MIESTLALDAFAEAALRGANGTVSAHLLLALLRPQTRNAPHLAAVTSAGLTYESVDRITERAASPIQPTDQFFAPSLMRVDGWAHGLAAAQGRRPHRVDHLVAVMHDLYGGAQDDLAMRLQAGATALRSLGFAVPDFALQNEWHPTREIRAAVDDDLDELVAFLQAERQSGFGMAVSEDGNRSLIIDDSIDAETLLARSGVSNIEVKDLRS
jgi:hypothetical protein